MAVVWDVVEIQKILPHRFPFLLVDKVVELHEAPDKESRVGRRIVAVKNVTVGESHFVGHFPKRPVMPGVLIIEALAQAGALAFFDPRGGEYDVAIAGINNARFRRPVVPGDTLMLYAKVTKLRGQMVVLECEAQVDGQKVAEAELLAFFDNNKLKN